jgi:hypothetical protein
MQKGSEADTQGHGPINDMTLRHMSTPIFSSCRLPSFQWRIFMALSKAQTTKIDEMIGNNKKNIDIVQELVGNQSAQARDVSDYLKENKTLQGMLKTISHRSKDVAKAGDEASRKTAVKEIAALSKKAIKILQQKADE